MQKHKKIVIADDNKEICELLSRILSELGYEVDMVHNGYDLMTYLETNTPTLIILDLVMPDKDGVSILNSVKQVSPHSRIVIYTGHQKYENSVYARAADRFLIKGGSVENLIEAIEELT